MGGILDEAKNLAIEFYKECFILKITDGVIKDQFKRASLSIPLNISEGSAKPTRKDRAKFYSIALGSLRETTTILEIIGNNKELLNKADVLGAHLYKLIQNPM